MLEESESKDWDKAKEEWGEIKRDFDSEEKEHCICGHAIKERCHICNIKSKKTLIVGNCCINNFLETDSNLFFQGLKRIKANITNSANQALIYWGRKEGILTAWEYIFYSSIWKKRKLTERQLKIKVDLNEKLLKAFKVGV